MSIPSFFSSCLSVSAFHTPSWWEFEDLGNVKGPLGAQADEGSWLEAWLYNVMDPSGSSTHETLRENCIELLAREKKVYKCHVWLRLTVSATLLRTRRFISECVVCFYFAVTRMLIVFIISSMEIMWRKATGKGLAYCRDMWMHVSSFALYVTEERKSSDGWKLYWTKLYHYIYKAFNIAC